MLPINIKRTQIPNYVIDQYVQMGFSLELINTAWESIDVESEMENMVLYLSSQKQQSQGSGIKKDQDSQLERVLLASQQNNQQTEFQIILPEQRKRVNGIPCGLKNIGNTCYFNSLIQIYFFSSEFVKTIITFQPPQQIQNAKIAKSIELVQHLQNLFIRMIGSDKKYVDPSEVVTCICDHLGNSLPVGDQKDVGEFDYYFLSRIQEGLTQKEQQNTQIQDSQIESSSSSSILKQKSSIIHVDDIVSQLFFCKVFQQFKYEQYGAHFTREQQELFNWIPLDIKDRNLYDSFESFVINNIDGYKNDRNAVQYNWISSTPQNLKFQIQRVVFCNEKRKSIKLNDEFTFDEEIYLDRFLKENREQYLNIRNKNKKLKSQLQQIKIEQELTKFNDQQVIENVITSAIQYFSKSNNGIKNHGLQNEQVQQFHLQQMQIKNQQLQQKSNDIEKQIQANFDNLKHYKYVLQSILMHNGQANCGHYYTYLKDFGLKKWFKFNDIQVEEVTKEKVFNDAFGKNNGENAYLLIYARVDIMEQEMQSQMRTYSISSQNQYLQDTYGSFLNEKQRQQLAKENLSLQKEIGQVQFSLIDKLIKSYKMRFNFINEQYQILSKTAQSVDFKLLNMLNYPIFIKSKMALFNKDGYENILKWVIIDSALRDVSPDKSGCLGNNIQITSDEIQPIMEKFNELKMPLEMLSQNQLNDNQQLTLEYQQYIQMASLASILLEKILSQNFQSALSVLHHLQIKVKESNQQTYFHQLTSQLERLIPIIIMCKMIPVQSIVNFQELELLQTYLAFQHYNNKLQPTFLELQYQIMMAAISENKKEPEIERIIDQLNKNNLDTKLQKQIFEISNDVITKQAQLIAQYDIYNWSPIQKSDILFDTLITSERNLKINFNVLKLLNLEIYQVINGNRKVIFTFDERRNRSFYKLIDIQSVNIMKE